MDGATQKKTEKKMSLSYKSLELVKKALRFLLSYPPLLERALPWPLA